MINTLWITTVLMVWGCIEGFNDKHTLDNHCGDGLLGV